MRYRFTIILISFLFLISCKKENLCDCVKSNGKVNTIYHDVANFNSIYTEDKIDVFLSQGNFYEVKVEAGANIQNLIKLKVENETLKVVNKNRCNWVRGYRHKINVYITAPHFNFILNNGLGTITNIGTLVQDSIVVSAKNSGDIKLNILVNKISGGSHGNGDLYLSGATNSLAFDYVGTNYLYASKLKVNNYIYLHSVTLGKSFINAPENGIMDISIEQAGNIYYKGNPATINLNRNHKGNLIKE